MPDTTRTISTVVAVPQFKLQKEGVVEHHLDLSFESRRQGDTERARSIEHVGVKNSSDEEKLLGNKLEEESPPAAQVRKIEFALFFFLVSC